MPSFSFCSLVLFYSGCVLYFFSVFFFFLFRNAIRSMVHLFVSWYFIKLSLWERLNMKAAKMDSSLLSLCTIEVFFSPFIAYTFANEIKRARLAHCIRSVCLCRNCNQDLRLFSIIAVVPHFFIIINVLFSSPCPILLKNEKVQSRGRGRKKKRYKHRFSSRTKEWLQSHTETAWARVRCCECSIKQTNGKSTDTYTHTNILTEKIAMQNRIAENRNRDKLKNLLIGSTQFFCFQKLLFHQISQRKEKRSENVRYVCNSRGTCTRIHRLPNNSNNGPSSMLFFHSFLLLFRVCA